MESRTMKDSGVEWIAEIPKDWEVVALKHIATLNDDSLSMGTPGDYEFNYIDIGSVSFEEGIHSRELTTFEQAPSRARRLVRRDDIIISTVRTYLKAIAIIPDEENVVVSTGFAVVRPVDVLPLFLSYAVRSDYYTEKVSALSYGVAYPSINASELMSIKVAIPKINEQQKIASFLDEKVAHIDNILEDTKKSIEYLKAYKKSLITETVTKGLNANVEMKDSGIEWIGEIPKHWNSAFLGQYFRQVKDKNKDLQEINLLSLSYGNIIQKDINTKDGLLPESFEGYNIIKKNDIVLRMTDLQNDKTSLRVGHATQSGIITSAYISIRLYNKFDSKYAYYFFHSFDIYKGFYGMGSGVRQNVTFNMLKKMQMLVPPIEDQKRIVDFIETKTCLIDNLIKNKAKMLQEIEAYKKSLIYEYVTGKKEVK